MAENTDPTVKEPVEKIEDTQGTTEDTVVEKPEETQKEEANEAKSVDRDTLIKVGDTVRVFYRIIEAGKERTQPYEGVVIAKKGKGISRTFTVRRLGVNQIGIERIFPINSPRISDITVVRKGKVRRAKLYYLRTRTGRKESKIKERSVVNK